MPVDQLKRTIVANESETPLTQRGSNELCNFISPSQPTTSQPSVPQPCRPTPLNMHLSIVTDYTRAPTQQPDICLARLKDPATLTVERLVWQSKELLYGVQVPYTEQVIVNGEVQTTTKICVEAYRSDGRLLNGNELARILKQGRTSVWLEDNQQLAPRHLPLLNNTTLVLYAVRRTSWTGRSDCRTAKKQLPFHTNRVLRCPAIRHRRDSSHEHSD